ncbi:UNVERIFIED_CONTAM: Retrovirus-related Pol polyprotein from transposon RE1 [Sesamum latifolium]|uniref:Retrovirus-related Pol polyprotein from transposon RE1 n=1 Tax=Sesamum latifolium TaxID=2727402 RepID=A0AAW2XXV3_9LAMI
MLKCKPISTPVEPHAKMCAHEGQELEDATMYRKLVGSLIYLTLTRPDISFAVGVMSRYMQNPKKPHLQAVRRILRYVKEQSLGVAKDNRRCLYQRPKQSNGQRLWQLKKSPGLYNY